MMKAIGAVMALMALFFVGRAEAATCGTLPFALTNGTLADATQVMANFNQLLNCANTLLAPLASPTLTGTPSAPTAGPSTNTTQLATTAFVKTAITNNNAASYTNAKTSCGAAGDGVTDDTSAINNCITTVNGAGGGVILFPAGTYLVCSTVTLQTGVILMGEGHNASIIKACATGSNDVIQTAGFATNTGTNNPVGPFGWGLSGIAINGNKGARSGGNCLSVYGYNYVLNNVDIGFCFAHGLYSEWSTSTTVPVAAGGESMESQILDVRTYQNGQDGIHWNGPHDSQMVNVRTFLNGHFGALFDNSASHSGGGTFLTNFHSYANTSTGVSVNANILFNGLESESNFGEGIDCTGTTFGSLQGANLVVFSNIDQGLNLHLGCPATLSAVQAFNNTSTGIQISNAATIAGAWVFSNTGDGIAVGTGDTELSSLRVENNSGIGINISNNVGDVVISGKSSGNTNQINLGTTLSVNSIISLVSFNTGGGQTSYSGAFAANTYVNIQTAGTGALAAVFSHP